MTEFSQNGQSVQTQFNIGRDQIIHNLVLVGHFLDFTRIQELISHTPQEFNFTDVSSAFDNLFTEETNKDFAQSFSFAGEILSDVIKEWLPTSAYQTLPIKKIFTQIPKIVTKKLMEYQYWEEASYTAGNACHYLPLPSVSFLWKKNFNEEKTFAIRKILRNFDPKRDNYDYHFVSVGNKDKKSKEYQWVNDNEINIHEETYEASFRMFQIFMMGLVIDLTRIHSQGSDNIKFWNDFLGFMSSKSK